MAGLPSEQITVLRISCLSLTSHVQRQTEPRTWYPVLTNTMAMPTCVESCNEAEDQDYEQ